MEGFWAHRISLITNKKNQTLSGSVTFIFEDLRKVSYLQAKGVWMYDIFFRKIMYKIIIFMGKSALIDFSLIIMSWKQFMKNNAIFLYSRIHTGSSFLQMTVFLPFRSEGSVNNMIKTLSNLGTNTEVLLLLKVQIQYTATWVYLNINDAFIWITNWITEVQTWQENPLFLFRTQKKSGWGRFIYY